MAAGRRPIAVCCALLATTHVAAVAWAPLAPVALFAWFAYAMAVPHGELRSQPRRILVAIAAAGAVGWTLALAARSVDPSTASVVTGSIAVAVAGTGAAALRCR